MTFEIGDKVLTTTGLYMSGEWREAGLRGKIVDTPAGEGGLYTVKFKGIEDRRFLRPEYLILRKKAKVETPKVERPFQEGDIVYFRKDVTVDGTIIYGETQAEVLEIIPDSNLIVVVEEETDAEVTVAEELVGYQEDVFPSVKPSPERFDHWGTEEESEFDPESVRFAEDSPEVQAALALVLERIEEIKALLTQGPRTEVVFNVHPSNGLTEEEVAEALREEEPAPEPVFKKAKEVVAGDLLYTEGGAYDKVDRIDTKASGYTSLYGTFGNRIAQVPSGRVVQVLEEVS